MAMIYRTSSLHHPSEWHRIDGYHSKMVLSYEAARTPRAVVLKLTKRQRQLKELYEIIIEEEEVRKQTNIVTYDGTASNMLVICTVT